MVGVVTAGEAETPENSDGTDEKLRRKFGAAFLTLPQRPKYGQENQNYHKGDQG